MSITPSPSKTERAVDTKPVYEFRPLAKYCGGGLLRHAGGAWIADDGEHDIAFAVPGIALYVDIGYQRNIAWSWLTTHWTGHQAKHPRGNPWHYSLIEGATEWGGDWGKDYHPNERAGREAMNVAIRNRGAASGRPIDFKLDDEHILAGLVRDQRTKEIVRVPAEPGCMYCGHDWLAARAAIKKATQTP